MTPASAEPSRLSCQRDAFDIPADVTYLNCASMAPQPRAVRRAGLDSVRSRDSPWAVAAADWFAGTERLRTLFARLVNADADGIAIVPSVSYAMAIAAANVDVRPGQEIVVLDEQFPSNVYTWRRVAARRGARLRTVSRRAGAGWTEAILDAVSGDAAVVAVPHCHWTDGALVDLERVGAAARTAGAALIVDASQSAGALPIDVAAVRPDFLATVGYKWLLGPYGLGYLYVAPRWRERGVPIEESWLTRAGSEDFARLVDYEDEYRAGARRFDMGQFPHFVLTPMAVAALETILGWRVERIQATLSALTATLRERARGHGGWTVTPAPRVGHFTGIRFDDGLPGGLTEALAAAGVFVAVRGDSIRVSPHLYTDPEDVERLLAIVQARSRG